MKKILLSAIVFASLSASAQWNQIGNDIDGEAAGDWSGCVVSANGDGTIIAIGAKENDGSFQNAGQVRVYENINGTWTQIGADIDGEAAGDYSGSSVSINNDGTIVAIGAPGNDGNGVNSGHVRVYKNISGTWTQIGPDFDGEFSGDEFGSSVSISDNGKVLAAGATKNDGNGNSNSAGHVRVYSQSINGIWTQNGNDIDGELSYDESGHSVSLSGDGTTVAIGAKLKNGTGGLDRGHVRVYQSSFNSWTQVGGDIDGEASGDNSGHSIALTRDLNNSGLLTLAIGAPGNDGNGNGSGSARVYQYTGGSWSKIGIDLDGEAGTNYAGISISLNADGSRVAVGASGNSDSGTNAGHVRVYENISGTWTQLGADIDGEAAGDQGAFVSLSNDGSIAVIGGMKNDGNGTDAGHVRVFDYTAATGISEYNKLNISIYPNPTTFQLTLNTAEQIQSISILDITGKKVKTVVTNTNTIDVSDLTKGIYFLQIQTKNGMAVSKFIKE